jgi:hypothetical protein
MSTGGRWGKSSSTRVHDREKRAIEDAQREQTEAMVMTPFLESEELQKHLMAGCFEISYHAIYNAVMVKERFHDVGGSMGWYVRTPAEALEHIERALPDHNKIYHPRMEEVQ